MGNTGTTCCSNDRSEHKKQPSRASKTEEIDNGDEGSNDQKDEASSLDEDEEGGTHWFEGTPITDGTGKVIGSAPKAARPDWLPKSGKGQSNVDPENWSITIEQWIMFIHACMQTETWKALVAAKGDEYSISMYDISVHFIVPWSRGTGCSIALLLNSAKGCSMPVELMLSHAWGGSTIKTFNCLQNLVNNHGVPPQTPVFFCALCLYQPEDGAPGGLSISQQLGLSPFGKVIKSNPKWGMWVIHVTNFEVYSRTWTVHDASRCTTFHCVSLRYLSLRCVSLCCLPLRCVSLRSLSLCYVSLRCLSVCCLHLRCVSLVGTLLLGL